MKYWIRRNGPALLIVVVMVVVVGVTVTRPAWRREIGSQQPQQTVRLGQSAVIDGVRWQLISTHPPGVDQLKKRELLPGQAARYPANSRLVPFALLRENAGERTARPPGKLFCMLRAVDGRRGWYAQTTPVAVLIWASRAGYSISCGDDDGGPLLVNLFVPITAHISAIDVKFVRSPPADEPHPEKALVLGTVRFDTG
jgi:hypothetical protein